jgi:hypothetical protein
LATLPAILAALFPLLSGAADRLDVMLVESSCPITADIKMESGGRHDAQIYTNNAPTLGQEVSRDVSHSSAIQQEPGAHKIEPQTTHTNQISQGFGLGL